MHIELPEYVTPTIPIPDDNNLIFVKREDLLPFSFGGNKVRIALEFINDMYAQGKNCIVGYGNARSNLCRALANLCYRYHIPCHIISPADEDGTRADTFNSKIVTLCGAKIHYCVKSEVKDTVESVLSSLELKGYHPYYIYGNSSGKGNEHIPLKAYAKVYEEIMAQFDYIFLATGTGMTQGGLIAAQAIHGGKEKIIGISVARSSEQETAVIYRSLEKYSEKVEPLNIGMVCVIDDYLCDGYGTFNNRIERTICEQMTRNGLPLDPTYTGKAFWGMQEYLKKNKVTGKKILFIHTGGTPLYFDYQNGTVLQDVKDYPKILDAVSKLEGNLQPSLLERQIDLVAFAEKLERYGKVWCYYDMGKPVSIIAGYFNDRVGLTAYLTILAVAPEYRGRKMAVSLFTEFEDYARKNGMKKIKLEVRKHNDIAQNLYRKLGFDFIDDASDTSVYMMKEIESI